jgi:tetratricopeptide (TPR) repeat protein
MSARKAIRWLGVVTLLLWSWKCLPQTVVSREQRIESHKRQVQLFLKQQRPDLAIPELRAIVALDPNNVEALGNLGVLLFFQNDYAAAIPQFRAALKLQPTLSKIQALLGLAEKRTGDIERARADLERAFSKIPDEKTRVETGMELIEIYNRFGDLGKSVATVGALRSAYPTNEEVLYTSYRIYSDIAGESMLSLSMVAPKSARMNQVMAHEMARQGDIEGAIKHYREALKLDPQLPGLHFELAEMLSVSSNATEQQDAEGEYKAALQLNQLDERAEYKLGEIAFRRGDVQAAYDHYSKAVQLQPTDAEAMVGLAKTLASMNQPEKAEALLEHAIQIEPTSSAAHFRLSALYRQMGRTDDTKHELEEFQKYKDMKEKLADIYREMRLEPTRNQDDQSQK